MKQVWYHQSFHSLILVVKYASRARLYYRVPVSVEAGAGLVYTSLIFLVEKRDQSVKARMCANGSTQREYMERDDASSPTVMCESILITAGIEAKQHRDVMTCDIPNALVQTDIPKEKLEKGKRIIMKNG